MKKLALSTALLYASVASSRGTSYHAIELKIGAVWYVGQKKCVDGNGVCISSQVNQNGTLFYDNKTGELWLDISDASDIFSSLKDTLKVDTISPIDPAVTKGLRITDTVSVLPGAYPIKKNGHQKTIHLKYTKH